MNEPRLHYLERSEFEPDTGSLFWGSITLLLLVTIPWLLTAAAVLTGIAVLA